MQNAPIKFKEYGFFASKNDLQKVVCILYFLHFALQNVQAMPKCILATHVLPVWLCFLQVPTQHLQKLIFAGEHFACKNVFLHHILVHFTK